MHQADQKGWVKVSKPDIWNIQDYTFAFQDWCVIIQKGHRLAQQTDLSLSHNFVTGLATTLSLDFITM